MENKHFRTELEQKQKPKDPLALATSVRNYTYQVLAALFE